MKIKKEDKKNIQLIKLWEQLSSEQKDVTLLIIQKILDQPLENRDNGNGKD